MFNNPISQATSNESSGNRTSKTMAKEKGKRPRSSSHSALHSPLRKAKIEREAFVPSQKPHMQRLFHMNRKCFDPYTHPRRNQQVPACPSPFSMIHKTRAEPLWPFNWVAQGPGPNGLFACNICFKTFSGPQAAAGHQACRSRALNLDALIAHKRAKVGEGSNVPSEPQLKLVHTPFGPILSPGFDHSPGPVAHVSSITNFLLGITDENLMRAQISAVANKQHPRVKQDQSVVMEVDESGYLSEETVNSEMNPEEVNHT